MSNAHTSGTHRLLVSGLVLGLACLLAAPAAEAGKKKNRKGQKQLNANTLVSAVPLPLPSSPPLSGELNVAVDDQTVPAAERKAHVTLIISNEGPEARLALCPTLNFTGTDQTAQGYGYLIDGTPDCTATFTRPPLVSTSLDPLQTTPLCPAAPPVVGDIVTVPAGSPGAPGQLVIQHEVLLASLGAGLESLPAAEVRDDLQAGDGTRLEILSGITVSSLVCPNGVGALMAAAPAPTIAQTSSVWSQSAVPVADTVTVPTSLSSATTLGMATDANATLELLWQDNLVTSLTGHLTHTPPPGPITVPKGVFFEGSLTAVFPTTLPEGFLGQATVRVVDSTSGAELARSTHLFAKDSTAPAITAASTVRDADGVDISVTASDATSLNAVSLTPSVDGSSGPASLMDLASGNYVGPTSFSGTIAPATETQSVGASVAANDDLDNIASAVLPVAGAGPDQTLECNTINGVNTTLDGTLSTTPPESPTTFTWTNSFGTATGETADVFLTLGSHDVTLTLQDGRGFTGTDQTLITVVDTTPPVIDSSSSNPACMWPPNHQMVRFTLGDNFRVVAHDVCDAAPQIQIVSVTSDQEDNARGSGNSSPDVTYGTGAFCVRSERSGQDQDGRVYTVTFSATDDSGNSTLGTAQIRVAHDQRGHDCPATNAAFVVADGDPSCTVDAPVATAGVKKRRK